MCLFISEVETAYGGQKLKESNLIVEISLISRVKAV